MVYPILTPQEAADFVKNGDTVTTSGFTAAGTPKVVTEAIAAKAEYEHSQGRPFKVNLFTGASTNDHVDGALARANAIAMRSPYQSHGDSRKRLNAHDINYFDVHLSEMSLKLRYGTIGPVNVASLETGRETDNGEILLGSGLGMTPTIASMADKIIIELNEEIPETMEGIHDIYTPLDPPYRREIPIYKASDRIGTPLLKVDPKKIVGVVPTKAKDGVHAFAPADETTKLIGANVCQFLLSELRRGFIPPEFLPLQSGVGNVANAVLAGLADSPEIPAFDMYTEVIQDSVISLMAQGKCRFASTCGMTLTDDTMAQVHANIDFFRSRIILRPGEISNSPEVVRRLGVITMNTALEADIFGNVNSTHVVGSKMMNGIGGSGDFTRNAYISIFSCPSSAKGGLISTIVPMVSHVDHSEHSVDVIITEQGIADLRGLDPLQRANRIIDNCVNPDYKDLLRFYLKMSGAGHTPHSLKAALSFHTTFVEHGDMRKTNFS